MSLGVFQSGVRGGAATLASMSSGKNFMAWRKTSKPCQQVALCAEFGPFSCWDRLTFRLFGRYIACQKTEKPALGPRSSSLCPTWRPFGLSSGSEVAEMQLLLSSGTVSCGGEHGDSSRRSHEPWSKLLLKGSVWELSGLLTKDLLAFI